MLLTLAELHVFLREGKCRSEASIIIAVFEKNFEVMRSRGSWRQTFKAKLEMTMSEKQAPQEETSNDVIQSLGTADGSCRARDSGPVN